MKKSGIITAIAVAILLIAINIYYFLVIVPEKKAIENNPDGTTSESPDGTTPVEIPEPTPVALRQQFNIDDFTVVDGSTVTIPYTKLLAQKTTSASAEEIDRKIVHNKTDLAIYNLTYPWYNIYNPDNMNSDNKFSADIIFTTKLDREGMYQDIADELAFTIEEPFARDGFVFLVNKDNPVKSLTQQQIVDIYSGKITNWREVGGDNAPIVAYQRVNGSGSQEGMLNIVMKDTEIATPTNTNTVVESMMGLVESIADYDNSKYAIGYSYYYYTTSMYIKDSVALLAVDGVNPSKKTIQTRSYPYIASYYVIIRDDEPSNSFARKLFNLVLSEDGQKVVEEAGYVRAR